MHDALVLLWLTRCRWRNKTLLWFRRMRKPGNLVGAFIALGCIGFQIGLFIWADAGSADDSDRLSEFARYAPGGILTGMLLMMVLALGAVRNMRGLLFTAGDVNHLFPGPLSKRFVLMYRMLYLAACNTMFGFPMMLMFGLLVVYGMKGQAPISLFNAAGAAVMTFQWMTILQSGLVLLGQRDASGYRPRRPAMVALALWGCAVLALLVYPGAQAAMLGASPLQVWEASMRSAPLQLALLPLSAARDLALEPRWGLNAALMWGENLGLLAAALWLVGRIPVNYYETSATASEGLARMNEAVKAHGAFSPEVKQLRQEFFNRPAASSARSRAWVTRGMWSLLQLNLIRESRAGFANRWLLLAPVALAVACVAEMYYFTEVNAAASSVILTWSLTLWVMHVRCDFRQGALNLLQLKTAPLSAFAMAAMMIASSTLVMLAELYLIAGVYLFFYPLPPQYVVPVAVLTPFAAFMAYAWVNLVNLRLPPVNIPVATSLVTSLGLLVLAAPSAGLLFLCGWNQWIGIAGSLVWYLFASSVLVFLAGLAWRDMEPALAQG